jgi:hypothetical protein
VIVITLIGYEDVEAAIGTITRMNDRDRLLPLHQCVTILNRYSNSSYTAQCV